MTNAYEEVDKALLGYGGKLYPADMKIEVRSADVPEIRMWSEIRDDDPRSVAQAIVDIILACTRVSSSTNANRYTVKDIYEHDKMALLLLIHSMTFADQKSNSLYVKGECQNSACGKVFDQLAVQAANLQYNVPDEKYAKYINHDLGLFQVQTKSYGTIEFKPSTIGVGQQMLEWMSTFQPKFVREHTNMFKLVQALCTDYRLVNAKYLRKLQVENYNNYSAAELSFRTNLVDALNITLKEELAYECPECHERFQCPLTIEGGYRSIFVPVQDIADELL
jgi:hypothetical protein